MSDEEKSPVNQALQFDRLVTEALVCHSRPSVSQLHIVWWLDPERVLLGEWTCCL
jgi:hypothetical protein